MVCKNFYVKEVGEKLHHIIKNQVVLKVKCKYSLYFLSLLQALYLKGAFVEHLMMKMQSHEVMQPEKLPKYS